MILITGGFGFQGFHLTRSLLTEGAEVRVLNHDSEHAQRNYSLLPKVGLRHMFGDVSNAETVKTAMRGCDAVIHLAAQINVDQSLLQPERSLSANIVGTMNVLEAARAQDTPVIVASSCEVYGTALTPLMTEEHPLNPRSPYAASKAAADRMAYAYHCSYDLPVVIVRPGNVYGWGQKCRNNGAVVARWMQAALNNKQIEIWGTGEQGRDFVHVSDVIAGYRAILQQGIEAHAGMTYNLGTGANTPMRDIAEWLGKEAQVELVYRPGRSGEVNAFALDSAQAKKHLGWMPKLSIYEGLWETWEEAQRLGGF